MYFVVESLYSYIQSDLIESQFAVLIDKLSSETITLDQISELHASFLKAVIKGCFLATDTSTSAVCDAIRKMLGLADQVCGLLQRSLDEKQDLSFEITLVGNVSLLIRSLTRLCISCSRCFQALKRIVRTWKSCW
jgi:hypothetical protein